jgi:membrane-bound inhibitor of C-type lysozyme
MKKIWLAVGIIVLIIIGLWVRADYAGGNVSSTPGTNFGSYGYVCDDQIGMLMTPASDMTSLHVQMYRTTVFPSDVTLLKGSSAVGAVYQGSGVTFTAKGETVTLIAGTSSISCTPSPKGESAPFNFGD